MTDHQLHTHLIQLFKDTARAHAAAFAATGGEDPEWPLWYTNYLQEPLGRALDMTFTKS